MISNSNASADFCVFCFRVVWLDDDPLQLEKGANQCRWVNGEAFFDGMPVEYRLYVTLKYTPQTQRNNKAQISQIGILRYCYYYFVNVMTQNGVCERCPQRPCGNQMDESSPSKPCLPATIRSLVWVVPRFQIFFSVPQYDVRLQMRSLLLNHDKPSQKISN